MTSLTTQLTAFYANQPEGQDRVAIIIPALNEAQHITAVVQMLAASAKRLGAAIIVVDGGS
ncbi:MAG: hypothetical protein ACNA7N_16020, partial [Yoonia sp.]